MKCDQMRERLAVWLYGDVPQDEAAQLEEHVRSCPACQGEHAVLRRVRNALDVVLAPEIEIHPAKLYRAASQADQRSRRRWRWTAIGLTAALAASLLVAVCMSVEVRCGGDQLVVRWGAMPSLASEPRPMSTEPTAREVALIKARAEEFHDRLDVLNELVHALATDMTDRDRQREASVAQLQRYVEGLQHSATQTWTDSRRDIQALYASQFGPASIEVNR